MEARASRQRGRLRFSCCLSHFETIISRLAKGLSYRARVVIFVSDESSRIASSPSSLSSSTHHRWILPPHARTIVLECCTWRNGTHLNLHGAVVMPDHVHLIFTPLYDGDSAAAWPRSCKPSRAPPRTRSTTCWSALGRFGSANRLIE